MRQPTGGLVFADAVVEADRLASFSVSNFAQTRTDDRSKLVSFRPAEIAGLQG
jgi:hypothetical protein